MAGAWIVSVRNGVVWLSSLLLAFVLASPATAALVAYEGFDYAANAGLLGLSGGSGWSGGWDDSQAVIGADAIQSGSMSYTDSMGNVLQTSGGHLLNTGIGGTSQGGRTLAARRATGTTWISFIAQRAGASDGDPNQGLFPRGANLAVFDLANATGANIEKLNIGPNNTGPYWIDPITSQHLDRYQFRYPSMNAALMEMDDPHVATNRPTRNTQNGVLRDAHTEVLRTDVNFVVIRIDHIGDEFTADDVRIWMNPRLDQAPSDMSVSAAYIAADIAAAAATLGVEPYQPSNFGDQAFDRLRLFAGNESSGRPYAEILWDEIRVGDTFADVAPYLPSGVPGDYNENGTVDAADFVVWRNGPATLPNEGASPGVVNQADYDFWRARFGATSGQGAALATAVPEPAAALMAMLACYTIASCWRRRPA